MIKCYSAYRSQQKKGKNKKQQSANTYSRINSFAVSKYSCNFNKQ